MAMTKGQTRRQFVTGAAAAAVAAASAAGAAGASEAAPAEDGAQAWDGEYDVVVVGFGGAGAVAAAAAADAGASVLVVDKAPWGEVGGNTRYANQWFMMSSDYDTTLAYYQALAGHFQYDEGPLETFVQGMVDQIPSFEKLYGYTPAMIREDRESCEYPNLGLSTALHSVNVDGVGNNAQLWKTMRKGVLDRSDKIDVWYASPALRLVQDEATRTVTGAVIDKGGEEVAVHALRGVVLTCGGFEHNEAMMEAYLGATNMQTLGTLYNDGDGIPMAAACGAEIRNCFNYSGYGNLGGLCLPQEEGRHAKMLLDNNFGVGSCLVAGGDGQRYCNENAQMSGHATREDCHGRLAYCGEFVWPNHPHFNHYVFDQAQYDELDAAGSLNDEFKSHIVSGSTVEELCAQMEGMDPDVLADTIRKYNQCVELGEDLQCGRPIDSMRAIDTSTTLYAIPMKVCMMNTQGGPRRNERYECVDSSYTAIPHLFSAGEFGGVVANYYQGAGNLSEVLVSGRVAGENAAANEPLESAGEGLAYTIDADYEREGQKTFEAGENEYIGQSGNGMGDVLQLKVTMDGDKIAGIDILDIYETVGVCDQAVAQIPAQILEKQSTEGIDAVAGATCTSNAIIEAVNDALAQAK